MERKGADRVAMPTASTAPQTSSEARRIDAVCGPEVTQTVLTLVMRWAIAQSLADVACARLAALVRTSMEHGLRFDPRGVTLTVRRVDLERARLDVRWHGSDVTSSTPVTRGDVASTMSTLDTVAHQWGFRTDGGEPVHWMIVDVRSPTG